MGLGKTVQVLALLLRRRRESREPALLVVPASLLANWKAEAERFAPSLTLLVAHPSEPGWETMRDAGARALDGADVVLTSYGTLQRLGWLSQVKWGLVVLDEAQAIKNPGGEADAGGEGARLRVAGGAHRHAGGEPAVGPLVALRLPQPGAARHGEAALRSTSSARAPTPRCAS